MKALLNITSNTPLRVIIVVFPLSSHDFLCIFLVFFYKNIVHETVFNNLDVTFMKSHLTAGLLFFCQV